jgi:hypothetical protein
VSFLWYWGAVWWWKTVLAWIWLSMMCKKFPWVRYWVFRRYITDVLDTTFQSFTKALLLLWLKEAPNYDQLMKNPWLYDYCVRNWGKEITFSNGSEIWFRWLQDKPTDVHFTKVWGLELTWAYIDEANECPEMGVSVLKKRVWRHLNAEYKIPRKVLCTFNPDKWWIYRTFWNPYKNGIENPDTKFIKALPTDNPYLTEEYLEELKNEKNEVLKQRLLYWNFDYDDTPWRLFDYNAILNMWDNPPIHWEKYISGDIARKWRDTSLIGIWNWLDLYKIIREDKSDLRDLSDTIRKEAQEESIMMRNTIIDENGVWWWVIDNLRCQGFINNARPRQPKRANISNVRNYDMLKTQCYFKLAELVNTWKIRISVDDIEFKNKLIEELDVIVEVWLDQDWKTRIIKKEDMIAKLWRSPDCSDMLMMRMFFELDKIQPIEQSWDNISYEHEMDRLIFEDDSIEIDFEDIDNPY